MKGRPSNSADGSIEGSVSGDGKEGDFAEKERGETLANTLI